jgi:hypothetical protein
MLEKRGKKAQVIGTFVVIGIVIIAVVLLGFLLYRYVVPQTKTDTKEILETKVYMEDKIQEATYDVLYLIGEQGGYVEVPQKSLITEMKSISYSLYFNEKQLPSKEDLEKQISDYIKSSLVFYLMDDLQENESVLKLNNFTVILDWNSLDVETGLEKNTVTVNINLISKIVASNEVLLEEYSTTVNCPLSYFLEIADQIVEMELKNTPINEKFFSDRGVSANLLPIDSLRTVYQLKKFDPVNDMDYVFNLAIIKND